MGKVQKKNAKGRLDRYYYLAKEKGYRARSSFKILQINEKYGHFLEKSKVVVDLCAAPGSWCQVASQLCPVNSLIVGVDIVPMKPLPKCITFQADITTEDCRSQLRGYLKTWKADTVMHDGAPNVGMNWIQDAYTQSRLTLEALRLAVEHLNPGGTFVTKVFRSRDYNNLVWVFKQLFDKVEATKPPASRNVSAEIFVVCKGFKAPKKMDPKFLDPKEVFEELPTGPANNESKVYNPEKKKRSRDGYAENDMTLFHPMDLMEWVKQEEDVVNTLGSVSKFDIDKKDPEWKILKKMKQTTDEFYECCDDLRVLGKKDFRMLLKWRKHAREALGILEKGDAANDKPRIEVEELTEDQRIDKELHEMKEKEQLNARREKRRKNEQKQKELQRLQMNMLTDMQMGIEAGQNGSGELFNLKTAEKTGQLKDLARGKRAMIFEADNAEHDIETGDKDELDDLDSAEEADNLEEELNAQYSYQKEQNTQREARLKAQLARGEDDEPWQGISDKPEDVEEGEDVSDDDSDTDSELDSDDDEAINKLIASISQKKNKNGLSKEASSFFADSIFQDVDLNIVPSEGKKQTKALKVNVGAQKKEEKEEEEKEKEKEKGKTATKADQEMDDDDDDGDDSSDDSSDDDNGAFQTVPNHYTEEYSDGDMDYSTDEESEKVAAKHREDIDISTAQAMTIAHDLATGAKSKYDIVNDGFNKYSFRDMQGLPDWFLDDEKQHNTINRPITKEASEALKEKMKLLNARPIKKVLEAQGRKKIRAAKRMERIKKKSDLIMEDGARSEADKARAITGLVRKMSKKDVRPPVRVVVARGSNRGLKGRPTGIKGKYKMVDGVMKHEMRRLKRIEKAHHKKRQH